MASPETADTQTANSGALSEFACERFGPPDRSHWEDLVREATGNAVSELGRLTDDGIELLGLYTANDHPSAADRRRLEPSHEPFHGQSSSSNTLSSHLRLWDLRQRHDLREAPVAEATKGAGFTPLASPSPPSAEPSAPSSPSALAAAVADDLAGGANSIWLRLMSPPSPACFKQALAGTDLRETHVVIDAGPWHTAAVQSLAEAFGGEPTLAITPADPLGTLARWGWLSSSVEEALDSLGESVYAQLRASPTSPGATTKREGSASASASASVSKTSTLLPAEPPPTAVLADATPSADAGAPPALELACFLATAAAYLEAVCARAGGITEAASVAECFEARLSVSVDQFVSLVKLRAARLLWARLLDACGVSARRRPPLRCWAVTSEAALSAQSPNVNLVRNTTAAFAAVCGGADCLTVLPHDAAATSTPSERSRRLARNISHLLAAESHLQAVRDPAGGSWYVEAYTQKLAATAWDRFRFISAAGGMASCLTEGLLAEEIEAAWRRRLQRLADDTERVVGVTHYRREGDEPTCGAEPVQRAPADAGVSVPPLPLRRVQPGHDPVDEK